MPRRLARILLAALAAAGIAVNSVLLGYADSRNDPVGKLDPRADLARRAPPAPTGTVADEHDEMDEADD